MCFSLCIRYITLSTAPEYRYVFAIIKTPDIPRNNIGFSLVQRKWASLSVNQEIKVEIFRFNTSSGTECLDTITLEVDFSSKKT